MVPRRVRVCVLALWLVPATASAFSSVSPAVPRLRPLDSWAAALLSRGIEESPTIRALVDRLTRADVIVYIEVGPKQGRSDGALRLVGTTRYFRMVHISLGQHLTTTELLGLLGHELYHAVEVADHPEIRCQDSLRRFYRTHGLPGSRLGTYDSKEAREAGHRVRAEVASGSTRSTPEPGGHF